MGVDANVGARWASCRVWRILCGASAYLLFSKLMACGRLVSADVLTESWIEQWSGFCVVNWASSPADGDFRGGLCSAEYVSRGRRLALGRWWGCWDQLHTWLSIFGFDLFNESFRGDVWTRLTKDSLRRCAFGVPLSYNSSAML